MDVAVAEEGDEHGNDGNDDDTSSNGQLILSGDLESKDESASAQKLGEGRAVTRL